MVKRSKGKRLIGTRRENGDRPIGELLERRGWMDPNIENRSTPLLVTPVNQYYSFKIIDKAVDRR
jgi:hypothetical protein